MPYKASSRYVRVAPSKARQVVAHIRGASVLDAQRVLQLSPKDVAQQILKTLNSAVANANNADDALRAEDLLVSAAIVEEGPSLKRYQPRAMGRAYKIITRTSHITIVVDRDPHADAVGAGRRGRRARRGEGAGAAGAAGRGSRQTEES
jgi:large subunit ribosomal protein L22